eukprot:g47697.t1
MFVTSHSVHRNPFLHWFLLLGYTMNNPNLLFRTRNTLWVSRGSDLRASDFANKTDRADTGGLKASTEHQAYRAETHTQRSETLKADDLQKITDALRKSTDVLRKSTDADQKSKPKKVPKFHLGKFSKDTVIKPWWSGLVPGCSFALKRSNTSCPAVVESGESLHQKFTCSYVYKCHITFISKRDNSALEFSCTPEESFAYWRLELDEDDPCDVTYVIEPLLDSDGKSNEQKEREIYMEMKRDQKEKAELKEEASVLLAEQDAQVKQVRKPSEMRRSCRVSRF